MKLRAVVLVLCLAAGIPAAWADERRFEREDYERFFAPGRFVTHSTYYASDGLLEVLTRRTISVAGQHMLEQSLRSLDISDNYDPAGGYPYYKIEGSSIEQMLWDDRRKAYLYEYTDADFDTNDSIVWESRDTEITISPDDRRGGEMHAFYKEVDRRLGRDVKALDDQYRRDVVGMWSWSCAYISGNLFEVRCAATHQPSQREEEIFYRRIDLLG